MAHIAYTEKRPNCKLCHLPSFGAFSAEFGSGEELIFLCAECGFTRAWATWTGHMSKKLKALRLEVIFKLPGDREVQPKPILPLERDFTPSKYNANFLIDGDRFTAPIEDLAREDGTFATEWAALERARQVSQQVARSIHLRSHWSLQTGISRQNGSKP